MWIDFSIAIMIVMGKNKQRMMEIGVYLIGKVFLLSDIIIIITPGVGLEPTKSCGGIS